MAEGDVIEIDRGVCAAERAEHPAVVIGRTASYEGLVGHGDEVRGDCGGGTGAVARWCKF